MICQLIFSFINIKFYQTNSNTGSKYPGQNFKVGDMIFRTKNNNNKWCIAVYLTEERVQNVPRYGLSSSNGRGDRGSEKTKN